LPHTDNLVDAGGFSIEEVGDPPLFFDRR